MLAIIDYNAGNIKSVCSALNRLNADWKITSDPSLLLKAERVILPGVGNFGEAMESLKSKGLPEIIKKIRRPVLGICVGMQVLCRDSEEGNCEGIGIFDAHIKKFTLTPGFKVPQMGWNTINNLESKLFKEVYSGSYVYYVHSYRADLCPDTIATTDYCDTRFSAALKYENFFGTQFHPEKSGDTGELIIKNFLQL